MAIHLGFRKNQEDAHRGLSTWLKQETESKNLICEWIDETTVSRSTLPLASRDLEEEVRRKDRRRGRGCGYEWEAAASMSSPRSLTPCLLGVICYVRSSDRGQSAPVLATAWSCTRNQIDSHVPPTGLTLSPNMPLKKRSCLVMQNPILSTVLRCLEVGDITLLRIPDIM